MRLQDLVEIVDMAYSPLKIRRYRRGVYVQYRDGLLGGARASVRGKAEYCWLTINFGMNFGGEVSQPFDYFWGIGHSIPVQGGPYAPQKCGFSCSIDATNGGDG